MEQLIQKIFREKGYRLIYDNNMHFYAADSDEIKDYYLVDFIAANQLSTYLTDDNFKKLLDGVKRAKESTIDAEKNTTLIVCAKVDDLAQTSVYKNNILNIEEDEYWFKKNVIIYTEDTVQHLLSYQLLIPYLNTSIQDTELFKRYRYDEFANNEYHLSMQLFVKLPLLTINELNNEINPIYNRIQETISEDRSLYEAILNGNLTLELDIVKDKALDISSLIEFNTAIANIISHD